MASLQQTNTPYKFVECTKQNLDTFPITEGCVYFKDTGEIYIDEGGKRKPYGISEEEKAQIEQNKNDILLLKKDIFVERKSKNLFNPNTSTVGAIQRDGSLSEVGAWANYSTSDFIEIEPNTNYNLVVQNTKGSTILARKLCLLYDKFKKPIEETYVNIQDLEPIIVNNSNAYYIRICSTIRGVNGIDGFYLTFEKGNKPTGYAPFFEKKFFKNITQESGNSEELVMSQKSVTDYVNSEIKLATGKPLSVSKVGEVYTILSTFNDKYYISIDLLNDKTSRNGLVNIERTHLIDKTSNYKTQIARGGDEITPLRLTKTVGANHGYPLPCVIASHDKTVTDLGSIWRNNEKNYILLKILDDGRMIFGVDYTLDSNGMAIYSNSTISGSMVHVSGATHTSTITIQGESIEQLYPSISNKYVELIVDDKNIIDNQDKIYNGNKVLLQQKYDVMDYKSIIDMAKNNIGIPYDNLNIDGIVRVDETYMFGDKGSCVVSTNLIALKNATSQNIGIIQSDMINGETGKKFRYIPDTKTKEGFDLQNGIDLSTFNNNLYFGKSDLLNPQIPISRVIDYKQIEGENQYGFVIGYITDKTDCSNITRINNEFFLDLRNTKKVYPIAISSNTILKAGESKTFECYRNYIDFQYGNEIIFYQVEDFESIYFYVDVHKTCKFESIKTNKYIGKMIEVVQKTDSFTLHNNTIDSTGILFSVNDDYGYAILKIKR